MVDLGLRTVATAVALGVCGCTCICFDGPLLPTPVKSCGAYVFQVEQSPFGVAETAFTDHLNADGATRREIALSVDITDKEDDNRLCGIFPGIFTLMLFPVWQRTDHHYTVSLSSAKYQESFGVDVKETRIMSILPWAYLPMLWHDKGYAAILGGQSDWVRRDEGQMEVLTQLIKGRLDADFYELAKYGKEGVKRRRAQAEAEERNRQIAAKEAADKAEAKARAERQARAREQKALEEQKEAHKVDALRTFALNEAPRVWATYQRIWSEVEVQNKRIADLRQALREFDRDPDADSDYRGLLALRDGLMQTCATLRMKLEDAYLAYCKFKATPGGKGLGAQWRKALDEGLQAADEAKTRFDALRQGK